MANRYDSEKPYFWQKSTLFDDCWIVVRRDDTEIIADFDHKSPAKSVAKELNQLMKVIEALGGEVEMVDDR